jgi:hypothetical protein
LGPTTFFSFERFMARIRGTGGRKRGTHLTIKKGKWLHSLQRKPHDCIQHGAQDGMVLHQRIVDVLLLQGQFHYGDRAFNSQPSILSVQNWHLHFIPANICLRVLRMEDCVKNWKNNSLQIA